MSNTGIGLKDLIHLFRLGRKRFNSPNDYKALEEYQGKLLARYLESHGLSLCGLQLLDLGAGLGGYASGLRSCGADVTCLDLALPGGDPDPKRICADALFTPFDAGIFDLVVCISLIEHVREPQKLVEEMVRVTKPGGHIYLSYPPFYSPVGGHHFSPWHLLGEKVAVWAFSRRKWHVNQNWTDEPYDFKSLSYEKAFSTYGLYPRTIREVRCICQRCSLGIVDQSAKYSAFNPSMLSWIGEFMTWQVQFILEKN